jgi:HlyD family secretion protein
MFLGGDELGQDGCHMRFAVVAVLVFLSAVGLGYTYKQNSPAPRFITAPVERGDIIKYVRANGVVEPVVTVEVSSQLSGRIADVLVNFNDTVTQGQVIARLDPESYDARVGEAKAALKVAEADALLQKKTIERAEASLHSAETALRAEQAQMNVEQARQEERERDYQRFLKLGCRIAARARATNQSQGRSGRHSQNRNRDDESASGQRRRGG